MASRTADSGRRPASGSGTVRSAPPDDRQDRRRGQIAAAKRLRTEQARRARHRRVWIRSGLGVGAAVIALLIVFLTGGHRGSGSYIYQVGQPGPGAIAPTFTLPSNMGGSFNLAAQRGKTVLLYFQEGVDCQPCWTQLQAIQHDLAGFHHAGVDEIVSITTDPLGSLVQAASTYGTTIPVLSDPNLAVSHAYDANSYGMMGTSMDGHSFVVVGPTGAIEWRADYGGAPNYTMYVPVPTLLAQMRAGLAQHGTS
ncbi:MAG: redoxin domain-containing protein [Actinomycetota bacterium]|nr:redoxin domain-containing protein [Actinomycetota bacterium]